MFINETGLFYCQQNTGDKTFEKFCQTFLPDVVVKEIESGYINEKNIVLVILLPSCNRQNHSGVLIRLINETAEKYESEGNFFQNIIFLNISLMIP